MELMDQSETAHAVSVGVECDRGHVHVRQRHLGRVAYVAHDESGLGLRWDLMGGFNGDTVYRRQGQAIFTNVQRCIIEHHVSIQGTCMPASSVSRALLRVLRRAQKGG